MDGNSVEENVPMTPYTSGVNEIGRVSFTVKYGAFDGVKVWFHDKSIAYQPDQCGDPGTLYNEADLNQDCRIDFLDFAEFASDWMLE